MGRIIWLAIVCILVMATRPAAAQEQCANALKTVKSFTIGSVSDRILFALAMTQDKWGQLQQQFGASLRIPFGDTLLPLSTSWSRVKQVQDNFGLNYRFQEDYAQSDLWYSEQVAQGAYDAYKACLMEEAAGTHIILRNVQGKTIRGTWFWRTSQTDLEPRKVSLQLSSNAKSATSSALVWAQVRGSAHDDFTIDRIGPGNINVTMEVVAPNGGKEDAALDSVPEPPTLYRAVMTKVDLPPKEIEFNAGYTDCVNRHPCLGVVTRCFAPTHPGGRVVNFTAYITRFETTRSTLGIYKVEGATGQLQPGTTEVCGRVGCEGYTYSDGSAQISNCSGHGIFTAQEEFASAWNPVPPAVIEPALESAQMLGRVRPSQTGLMLPDPYLPRP